MLDTILTPRVLAVLGIIGLGLFAFSFAWAFFKVSYQKAVGKPVPRFWLTNACDVLAEIGANLPGAINRALKLAGKPGLFLPTAPADGSAPTASAATIDALSAELTRLRDALAAYQRRVSDSHVVTEPNGFDPSQRQTIAPDVAAQIASETLPRDGQRGATSFVTALVVVALVGLVLSVGALLTGCPAVREAALRATPGVPDHTDCRAGAQRCAAADGGALPEVCSGSGRWWPALPRSADGTQRVCPAGCALADGGVAYCAADVDGGAR